MSVHERDSMRVAAALCEVGMNVSNVYDLVNSRRSYPEAVPVLLRLLNEGVTDVRIKEGIVRALAVRDARGVAARPLIELFKSLPDEQESLKWAAGNTLSVVADDSVTEDIIELVRDARHGKAREMLPLALCNTKSPRAADLLVELLDDEQLVGHALIALRRLKVKKGVHKIESLTTHPKTWIANEAKRTLARMSK